MSETESDRIRRLIATIYEAQGASSSWGDVNCTDCGTKIAETTSTGPLPVLYCPSCAVAAKED